MSREAPIGYPEREILARCVAQAHRPLYFLSNAIIRIGVKPDPEVFNLGRNWMKPRLKGGKGQFPRLSPQ